MSDADRPGDDGQARPPPTAPAADANGCGIVIALDRAPPPATLEDWAARGVILGRRETRWQWSIGDWWAAADRWDHAERTAIVTADDWSGPSLQTAADAAVVARAFPASRRREVLSFTHHREVAALPADLADGLLDWAEQGEHGRPRSTRALRERVREKQRDLEARGRMADLASGKIIPFDSEANEMLADARRREQEAHTAQACAVADAPTLAEVEAAFAVGKKVHDQWQDHDANERKNFMDRQAKLYAAQRAEQQRLRAAARVYGRWLVKADPANLADWIAIFADPFLTNTLRQTLLKAQEGGSDDGGDDGPDGDEAEPPGDDGDGDDVPEPDRAPDDSPDRPPPFDPSVPPGVTWNRGISTFAAGGAA